MRLDEVVIGEVQADRRLEVVALLAESQREASKSMPQSAKMVGHKSYVFRLNNMPPPNVISESESDPLSKP